MIILSRPTPGLFAAINTAGHYLNWHNNAWLASDEAAVQAIINGFDMLTELKADKIKAIKAEGLKRVQVVYHAIVDFDMLILVRDEMLSIAPAARQLTTNMTKANNICQAGLDAVAAVNALTLIADVDNYNVVTQPAWPA